MCAGVGRVVALKSAPSADNRTNSHVSADNPEHIVQQKQKLPCRRWLTSLDSGCAANTHKAAEVLLQLGSSGNEVWKKQNIHKLQPQTPSNIKVQKKNKKKNKPQYCKTVAPASTTLINIIITIIWAGTFQR